MLNINAMKNSNESINILTKLEEFYDKFIITNADYLIQSGKIEEYLDTRDNLLLKISRLKRSYNKSQPEPMYEVTKYLLSLNDYRIHINSREYETDFMKYYPYEELIKKVQNIEHELIHIKTELISIKKN